MAGIFISYRERDSKAWALSLRDRLVDEFGEDKVFLDKDTLRAGKWKDQIERALGDCNIVLVVIGRGWIHAKDDEGRQRLMSDDDVHRREIAMALARSEVTVVPVLVDGAAMPKAEELPENIRDLIQQQSRSISDSAAHRKVDLDALSADIRRVGRFPPKADPTPVAIAKKYSGKIIGALCLVVLVFAAASEGLDHDEKLGGIFIGGLALWLAWSGFKDTKAGLAKGKGLGITAVALSALATLGMIGALAQPDSVQQPLVNNIGPATPALAPVINTVPQPPILSESEPAPPVAKPIKPARQEKPAPVAKVEAANFEGVWQDGYNMFIFYVTQRQGDAIHFQQYNMFNGQANLVLNVMAQPVGNEIKIDAPTFTANLALASGSQQMMGSAVQKGTGLPQPVLMTKRDLNSLDPQVAAALESVME